MTRLAQDVLVLLGTAFLIAAVPVLADAPDARPAAPDRPTIEDPDHGSPVRAASLLALAEDHTPGADDVEIPDPDRDPELPGIEIPEIGCTPHPPIEITEDHGPQGFTWTNPVTGETEHRPGSGVVAGEGTAEDPYVIEGWCIAPESDGQGIRIADTSAHLLVRQNVVHGETPPTQTHQNVGTLVERAENVTVEQNTVTANRQQGIAIVDVPATQVLGNEVRGNGAGVHVDGADRTTIEDNNVSANQGAGIRVVDAPHTEIRDNEAHRNGVGVSAERSRSATIEANAIVANGGDGVAVRSSADVAIRDNHLERNQADGIDLDWTLTHVEENTIAASGETSISVREGQAWILDNTMRDSGWTSVAFRYAGGSQLSGNQMDAGIFLPWWPSNEYDLDIDTTNTVNGDPLHYLHEVDQATITSAGQIVLVDASNVHIEEVRVVNASVGLLSYFSEATSVQDAVIRDNVRGIETFFGSDLTLANVTLADNGGDGAWIDETEGVTIAHSRVRDNGRHGLHLYWDAGAHVHNTTIVDNGEDALLLDHDSHGTFADNVLSGNGDDAVEVHGDSIHRKQDVDLRGNDVEDNDGRGLVVHGSKLVDARDNWWGHASGPSGDVEDACTGTAPDGEGMSIATGPGFFRDGEVCFDPWLTEPNPTAGP